MDLSEEQIMADILNRLVNSGYWGKGHQNIEQLTSWVKNHVKEDGVKVRKCIRRLSQERFIGINKGGKSIYANPRYRKEIAEFIEKYLNET
jgi:hypothetical protein